MVHGSRAGHSRGMRTAAITAALDEVAAIDPATCEPWGGVRRVWQEGESTPAASVFWVEPFAGRRVLVVATRSRRLLNGWLAAHALRPARRRRRAAERAGAASPVYSSADGTPLPADEAARRLGLGPAAPVWGPGGAAADAAYLSDVPDAAFLDGPALLRVADTEAAAAAVRRSGHAAGGDGSAGRGEAPSLHGTELDGSASPSVTTPGGWLGAAAASGGGAGLTSSRLQAQAAGSTGFHASMRLSPLVRPAPRLGMAAGGVDAEQHEACAAEALRRATALAARGERAWGARSVGPLWRCQPRRAAPNGEPAALPRPSGTGKTFLRAELDPQHAALLERVRFGGSQWILGLDAEWSDAVPATTRKGRQQRPATLDSVWGLAGDGAVPLRLPRVPGAADVIQLATHNAVLVASLTQ